MEHSFEHIKAFLTKDFHGLPVWAWGLIAVGGIGIGWYITSHLPGNSSTTTTTDTGTPIATPVVPAQPNPPAQPTQPQPVNPIVPITPIEGPPPDGGPTNTPTNPLPGGTYNKQLRDTAKQAETAAEKAQLALEEKHTKTAAQTAASALNLALVSLPSPSNTVAPRATNQPYRSTSSRGPVNA